MTPTKIVLLYSNFLVVHVNAKCKNLSLVFHPMTLYPKQKLFVFKNSLDINCRTFHIIILSNFLEVVNFNQTEDGPVEKLMNLFIGRKMVAL